MKITQRTMKLVLLAMIPLTCSLIKIKVYDKSENLCFGYPIAFGSNGKPVELELCSSDIKLERIDPANSDIALVETVMEHTVTADNQATVWDAQCTLISNGEPKKLSIGQVSLKEAQKGESEAEQIKKPTEEPTEEPKENSSSQQNEMEPLKFLMPLRKVSNDHSKIEAIALLDSTSDQINSYVFIIKTTDQDVQFFPFINGNYDESFKISQVISFESLKSQTSTLPQKTTLNINPEKSFKLHSISLLDLAASEYKERVTFDPQTEKQFSFSLENDKTYLLNLNSETKLTFEFAANSESRDEKIVSWTLKPTLRLRLIV